MQVAATPDNWDGDEYVVRNARLCAAYQTVLAEANRLDFDDRLLATVRTLHEHPNARRAAGDRFPRVLVDEYQHTNLPQYVLVRQLAEGHNDVFVVGDPDQAIYGWRGAELTNTMSFQRDFPAARRIYVVRVAGCRRGLRDAAEDPFRGSAVSTNLLHDSQELARRDAGHESSGAAVHVIRSHGHCRAPQAGRRPMLKCEGIGICTLLCTLREQTPPKPRLVDARKRPENQGEKLEPASGLEPLTC